MRSFFKRALFIIVSFLFLAVLVAQTAAALTQPDPQALPPLKDGDLIFQTNLDTQSLAVMLASGTVYTHIGMIKIRRDGTPVVVEVGPVRETPLQAFINRGFEHRIAIRRIRDLKPEDAALALAWAKKQYGKPYDLFFLNDENRFYCSELIEDAFKEGAGISLGKYQKIGELAHSSAMDKVIQARWRDYPLCQGDKSMTYGQCYQIIMKQELITPASIARDPRTELIYSNYLLGD